MRGLPKRPNDIYSQFHLDNWTDGDFATHAVSTRKTLRYLIALEDALSNPDFILDTLRDQFETNLVERVLKLEKENARLESLLVVNGQQSSDG